MAKRQHEENGLTPLHASNTNGKNGSLSKKRKVKQSEITNGNAGEQESVRRTEEERKEKGRLRQLKKKEDEEDTSNALNLNTSNGSEAAALATEKAARKAEKKRLKALKNVAVEPEPEHANTNGKAIPIVGSKTASEYKEDPALSALPQAEVDAFLSANFITIADPTTSKTLRPIISFSQLPQSAHLKPSPFGSFKNPTPIQSAAWPFLLAGRDVIGVAETGSGKTLAFGVPCIRYISSLSKEPKKGGAARAVIVSPTRELAVQIHEQIITLAGPAGLKSVCVYGGVPKDAQRSALRSAHIVVATPGRLNDLINEGSADLSNVGYVVLDEADRMLDKGFEDEIRKIIATTAASSAKTGKPDRQTLMFTATWPQSIRDLAATFMRSPVKIAIGDNPEGELRANTRIVQKVEVVDPRSKEMRLLQLIKEHQSGKQRDDRILVFCLYKKEATRIEMFLRNKGLRVAGIHGDLSQEKRSASLDAFKNGGTPLLVATDVAARGLDIPAVKVVINVTFPLTVEDYVHRIGR